MVAIEKQNVVKFITIENAKLHNLKNVTVSIPLGKITLISGVSGSGKSTLAVDILGRLSRQKYIDLLGGGYRLPRKPISDEGDFVGNIVPICPSIIFHGLKPQRNPKSTVGTISGLRSDLKNLFLFCGRYSCPECGEPIEAMEPDEIVSMLFDHSCERKIIVKAPLDFPKDKQEGQVFLFHLLKSGFLRVEYKGRIFFLDEDIEEILKLMPMASGGLNLIIDRFRLNHGKRFRLFDAIRTGLNVGEGRIACDVEKETGRYVTRYFSTRLWCPRCRRFYHAGPGEIGKTDEPSATLTIAGQAMEGLESYTLADLLYFLNKVEKLAEWGTSVVVDSILQRILLYLRNVKKLGIDYLELGKPITQISSGEFLKLRLTNLVVQKFTGVLFILDEALGALPVTERRVISNMIRGLNLLGNTIVMIDHCSEAMELADYLVEIGPGSGKDGGEITHQGWLGLGTEWSSCKWAKAHGEKILKDKSLVCEKERYLVPLSSYFSPSKPVEIVKGVINVITGPTGSGKTRLLKEIYHWFNTNSSESVNLVIVPQGEIFKGKYSTPATVLSVFAPIRSLFARTKDARKAGFGPDMFSLTKKGGRCHRCKGTGEITTEGFGLTISYLCPACKGAQYNQDVLAIRYKGFNIKEVLDLSCSEAADLFASVVKIRRPLEIAERSGIGYLALGQPIKKLSTGEAQRLKIASYLTTMKNNKVNIFFLDQPTSGLHPRDVESFACFFDDLIKIGSTLIIAENNDLLIRKAHNLIKLSGAGPTGGRIIWSESYYGAILPEIRGEKM